MVGIISNASAFSAQRNLEIANRDVQDSIARLSSGKRIVSAADDVAGLAVGTVLQTNVSTLKAALTNTSQALSLLGLADSALENISDILQRQKALASQATSGSLDDNARSFLNQEFENLKNEVDRIANSTNFNGIKLIDGSLFDPASLETSTSDQGTAAAAVLEIATALADGHTLAIDYLGTTVTFTGHNAANTPATDANMLSLDITTHSTTGDQVTHLKEKIDAILNYSGTTADVVTAKRVLSKLNFAPDAANNLMTITHKASGEHFNDKIKFSSAGTAANAVKLDGVDIANGAQKEIGNAGIVGVDGDLHAGDFASGATAYSGNATAFAQGSVSDSILRPLATTTEANTGVNVANISNNPEFIGTIQGFKATYIADEKVDIEITVGETKYSAKGVRTNPDANTIVTLTSVDSGKGSFDIQFAANNGESSVKSQKDADTFATRLDKAFEKVDFYQKREISNFTAAGTVYPTGSTTASGDLSGSEFTLINTNFNDIKIEDVKVKAPTVGSTEALIEFMIDGEVYRSGYSDIGAVAALGSSITNNNSVGFVSVSNPNNVLAWTYNNSSGTNLSITNDAEAEGLERALKNAFKIGTGDGGKAGLEFQVGTTSSDKIEVQIANTTTRDIYKDENGIYRNISIGTQENATESNDILDLAIQKVISVRANVGSLQSRFNFASANIKSSIENVDAARSVFLDADIPSESTESAQV